MENDKLEKILKRDYPVEVSPVTEEDGSTYYFAFLPDFGHSACSAVGDTEAEAIEDLELVKRDVITYYLNTGKRIPMPDHPAGKV